MAERWGKERIVTSQYAFQILKIISSKEQGSYATEIDNIIEINDREEASRVINKLEEIGLVKKGERTRAQYYKLRREGLTSLFFEMWNLEQQTPRDLGHLLEEYLKNYENPDGTIKTLLKRDFANGLNNYLQIRERNSHGDLIDFFQEIDGINKYETPSSAFEKALKSIQT